MLVIQSCLTLCDHIEGSPQDSSVHGVLQAQILEWVAIFFSRGFSQPRDWTQVSVLQADSLLSEPPGKSLFDLIHSNIFLYRCILNLTAPFWPKLFSTYLLGILNFLQHGCPESNWKYTYFNPNPSLMDSTHLQQWKPQSRKCSRLSAGCQITLLPQC